MKMTESSDFDTVCGVNIVRSYGYSAFTVYRGTYHNVKLDTIVYQMLYKIIGRTNSGKHNTISFFFMRRLFNPDSHPLQLHPAEVVLTSSIQGQMKDTVAPQRNRPRVEQKVSLLYTYLNDYNVSKSVVFKFCDLQPKSVFHFGRFQRYVCDILTTFFTFETLQMNVISLQDV